MNMASNDQLKAYQQPASPQGGYTAGPQGGTPTYTEAWALIEAARRMAAAIEQGITDDPQQRRDIRDALRLNWRLWTIFQSELTATDESPVPDDIRMNMLTLCKFVDEHTVGTMAEPTPEKIVTLIDMNRNIASGLLDSLKAADADTQGQQAQQPEPPKPTGTATQKESAPSKTEEPEQPTTRLNLET